MTFAAFKRNIFILEGLNGFASSLYFNFIFFYLRDHFGFGPKGNLFFCAANGFLYTFGAYYGGKFAQKRGYLTALRTGCAILVVSQIFAFFSASVAAHSAAMVIWTLGVCLTWPSLEALTSEGESSTTLPRKIGIYNVVWSIAFAAGLFLGGMIIDALGWKSMFIIPAAIHALQVVLIGNLKPAERTPHAEVKRHEADQNRTKAFLRMAWLANPFAYIAMNTVIPLIPQVADKLALSKTAAGLFGSVWMFARTASFFALWKWTGWHYRFGWLLASYLLMILTFAAILLLTNLYVLVAAQIVFGFAVGLIYYSSLFYSMDSSDAKGEHGGLHEAAIGLGIFGGPAIGVTALYLFPTMANASAWTVSGVLTLGAIGLFGLRKGR